MQRKGFKTVRKTYKDVPSLVVDYESDGVITEVVLFVRDDKARPLLGLRKGKVENANYIRRFSEKVFPLTLEEALAIADGSFIPVEYDEKTNAFKRWNGKLNRDEPEWLRGYIIARLMERDKNRPLTKRQIKLAIERLIHFQATWFYQTFKHFKA